MQRVEQRCLSSSAADLNTVLSEDAASPPAGWCAASSASPSALAVQSPLKAAVFSHRCVSNGHAACPRRRGRRMVPHLRRDLTRRAYDTASWLVSHAQNVCFAHTLRLGQCFAVMDLTRGFRTRRVRAAYLHDRADSLRAMDRRLYVCARRARVS